MLAVNPRWRRGAGPDAVRDLGGLPLRAPATARPRRRSSSASPSSPPRPRRTWRGVRVVKAFAQEERQLRRFNRAVARVFDQSMVSTRLRAFYNPFIGFLPQLGLAAILLRGRPPGDQRPLTVGEFVAFYGYVLMLTSPMRMLGVSLGMAQRAVASGARVFELLDRDAAAHRARRRAALPDGGGRVELRDVTFGYDDGEPCCATSTWRWRRADGGAGGRHRAPARRPRDRSSRASTTSTRARCWWTAPTCATSTRRSLRQRDRAGVRRRLPVLRHACARTSPTRARGARDDEVRGGRARAGLDEFVADAARRLRHARGRARASRSPAASASAWRSPGRCSPSRAS